MRSSYEWAQIMAGFLHEAPCKQMRATVSMRLDRLVAGSPAVLGGLDACN